MRRDRSRASERLAAVPAARPCAEQLVPRAEGRVGREPGRDASHRRALHEAAVRLIADGVQAPRHQPEAGPAADETAGARGGVPPSTVTGSRISSAASSRSWRFGCPRISRLNAEVSRQRRITATPLRPPTRTVLWLARRHRPRGRPTRRRLLTNPAGGPRAFHPSRFQGDESRFY